MIKPNSLGGGPAPLWRSLVARLLALAALTSAATVCAASAAAAQGTDQAAPDQPPPAGQSAPVADDQGATIQTTKPQGPAPATTAAKMPLAHFDIDEYQIQGADHLAQIEVEEAVYPFLGPGRTADDIEKARAALEKAYHDKGFQTVTVSIPQQNAARRVIVLKVAEAKVGRLRVKGSRFFDLERIKEKAPSVAEGKLPNFNEVTNDIVSLNQWPDRKVTPALRAGLAPGTVDVDLDVDDKLPLHGSVELNNRESPNTTALRVITTGHYDDLWQRGDSFTFSYQVAPERPSDAIVYSGSYLARSGIDWLNFLFYGVDSKSDVSSVGGTNIVGPGQILGSRAVFTLPSRNDLFQTVSLGIDYKHFEQTVSQDLQSFGSPVTYYPLAANYTATFNNDGATTVLNAGMVAGTRGLGSDPPEFDNKRSGATTSFFYVRGDASDTREFPDKLGKLELYSHLQGQIADQPLVSSEEFSATGADYVRGYLESEVLGDSGFVGTLELRTPNLGPIVTAPSTTTNTNTNNAGTKGSDTKGGDAKAEASTADAVQAGVQPNPLANVTVWNDWRFFGFTDVGEATVLSPLAGQQENTWVASYGLGARAKMFDYANWMVAVAIPVFSTTYTSANHPRVIFRLWGEF